MNKSNTWADEVDYSSDEGEGDFGLNEKHNQTRQVGSDGNAHKSINKD